MGHYKRLRKCKKLRKWKKTCVKKAKVTSQISTRAFNKKDNKKYYKHYDDDANNTMIDIVNDDCLAEIFMYLSAFERPKIALVCKNWKKAFDYSWLNVNKLELRHWENNEYPSYSYKYPTIDGQLSFLRSQLDKYGRYLTELDLTANGNCNIVPIINESCPKLVKLRLRFQYIEHKLLVNAFSRLSKLKVLKIIFQNIHNNGYIPVTLIKSLRSLAGTLTELTLLNWNENFLLNKCRLPKTFTRVIPKLKALKSIETAGVQIDTELNMYLEYLEILIISHDIQTFDESFFNMDKYKNVTQIQFSFYQVTDDCLYTIANCLKKLDLLKTRCERVTDAGIEAVSKMDNLTCLYLRDLNRISDSSFKLLKNLEIIRLHHSNKIAADDAFIKIIENSLEIKLFYLKESAVTSEFIKKAAEIATNRKIKLELGVLYIPDIKQYATEYLHLVLFDSSTEEVYNSENNIDIDN